MTTKEHKRTSSSERKREDWIPYTYLLIHNKTGMKYYGVRFAKGCHPNDLWKTYWSSSTYVKKLLKEDGPASFSVFIRKTFSSSLAARNWETKVLRRLKVVGRSDFLNKTDNHSIAPMYGRDNPASRPEIRKKISLAIKERLAKFPNSQLGKFVPDYVKEKQSLAKKRELNPFYGKTHSIETKKVLSERQQGSKNSFYGKTHSVETKQKLSQSLSGIKKPTVNCPFCEKTGAPNVMYRWHFENCKKK